MAAGLALDPGLDDGALAAAFRRHGRLHISGILTPASAKSAYEAVVAAPWRMVLNAGDKVYEIAEADWGAMPESQRSGLVERVHAAASQTFQYKYWSCRLSDEGEPHSDPGLNALVALVNGAPFLSLLRKITGEPRVAFADAQATRYGPGDFLTAHDDGVAGKNRLAAFVLNLTPQWRADFGGLLAFVDADGHVAEAYTPAFNALNVFRVPHLHAVTAVAPFAPGWRYSVTGWLRSR